MAILGGGIQNNACEGDPYSASFRPWLQPETYAAALNARFPPGTPDSAVKDFAIQNGGDCTQSPHVNSCLIAVGGEFCLVTNVILTFPVGTLDQPIEVRLFRDGC